MTELTILISLLSHLDCALPSLQYPWDAFAILLNRIQELLVLTFFSVVDSALLLIVRKFFEAFCSSHSF